MPGDLWTAPGITLLSLADETIRNKKKGIASNAERRVFQYLEPIHSRLKKRMAYGTRRLNVAFTRALKNSNTCARDAAFLYLEG